MKADELESTLRSPGSAVRVSKLTLRTKSGVFKGEGSLREESGCFRLKIDFARGIEAPSAPKGVVLRRKDAWSVTGTIERCLRFRSEMVSPIGGWSRTGGRYTIEPKCAWIDVVPSGFDRLTSSEKNKMLGAKAQPRRRFAETEIHAVLPGWEAPFVTHGTEVTEENDYLGKRRMSSRLDTYLDSDEASSFAFIQRGSDVHVYFRSGPKFRSRGAVDDRDCRFHSLLTAVAFASGRHAWPRRLQHWRNGALVLDRLKPVKQTVQSHFRPFLGELRVAEAGKKCGLAVRKLARWFEKDTELSRRVAHLLYLLRESDSGKTPFEVRTLALGSLFEGLIDAVFEELCRWKEPIMGAEFSAKFERAKAHAFAAITGLKIEPDDVRARLQGILRSARPFRVDDMAKMVAERLTLDWEKVMKPALAAWRAERHGAAHGRLDGDRDETFVHQSRIAGAMNAVVLKLAGYSGPVAINVLGSDGNAEIRQI